MSTSDPGVKKGFQTFRQLSGVSAPVAQRVEDAVARSGSLAPPQRAILRTILESYRKADAGEPFAPADFVLSPHEVAELDRLEPSQHAKYLCYRYAYVKYPELHIVDAYPPCVQIEITSICNYRCTMCYQADETFSHKKHGFMGVMSYDLFARVIDQLEGHVEGVTLASRGEPTLHKDFGRMLAYASGKFLGFKVNTNASHLTEENTHHILRNMTLGTIVFSLETNDPVLYREIRVNGEFERVFENIARFRKIKDEQYPDSKIITRVSGVQMDSRLSVDGMTRFWSEYVDQVTFVQCMPWTTFYGLPQNDITAPCSDLWRRFFVWWDGTANPCDNDYKSTLAVGNVNDTPISELWTSGRQRELRERHLAGQRTAVTPCLHCPSV